MPPLCTRTVRGTIELIMGVAYKRKDEGPESNPLQEVTGERHG